jgi:hypothetical protein
MMPWLQYFAASSAIAPSDSAASAAYACQLDRCADVELQLILQMLTNKERLISARINGRMLHAAGQPFSWKNAELAELTITAELAARIHRSLMRLARFHLIIDSPVDQQDVGAIFTIPHVDSIHLTDSSHAWIKQLVAGAHSLRKLLILQGCNSQELEMVSRLPLHTLKCSPAISVSPLVACVTLTDLDLICNLRLDLSPLSALSALTRLSIFSNCLKGALASCFVAPMASSLLQLELREEITTESEETNPSYEELSIMFSNLTRLRALVLQEMGRGDIWLSQLPFASTVQSLIVRGTAWYSFPTTVPSASALEIVLSKLQSLSAQLEITKSRLVRKPEMEKLRFLPRLTLILVGDRF